MTDSTVSNAYILKFFGSIFLMVAGAVAIAYFIHVTDRPVARHVPAEPYEWPLGCKPAGASNETGGPGFVQYYTAMHNIPAACMDQKYYIADPHKYGLKGFKGLGLNYYRVGPDAVDIDCHSGGTCVVVHIERDVFSESGNFHE